MCECVFQCVKIRSVRNLLILAFLAAGISIYFLNSNEVVYLNGDDAEDFEGEYC